MISLAHPARVALQSAEFLALYGVFGPFEFASPLLQILLRGGNFLVGNDFQTVELFVRVCVYLVGCVAAYALARDTISNRAGVTTIVTAYCASPSRLYAVFSGAAPNELLFWSLIPLGCLALARSRRGSARFRALSLAATVLALVSARAWTLTVWDAVALLEFCALAAILFHRPARFRVLRMQTILGALVLLGAIYDDFKTISTWRDTPPQVAGIDDLRIRLNPILSTVSNELFRQPSHENISDAILWARAMGTRAVWASSQFRYDDFNELLGSADFRAALDLGGPIPGDAIIVSRHQWERLPKIRGLYDREALERYLAWAGRPESLSVRVNSGRLTIDADLSAGDVVLIRVPFDMGWQPISVAGRLARDPIGYTVFVPEPSTPGDYRIDMAPSGFRLKPPSPAALHSGAFPTIKPNGLIHGTERTPPPFLPGDVISIFGTEFLPTDTQVKVDMRSAEILWTGPSQINVKLPVPLEAGKHEIVVESGGLRSFPRSFEVIAP